ncbi:hypothetical protein [Burkholderia gladioli]|uniref:hypothetical protein n=1 Tax=Burkholderia gladioli TaxID=28095 RepID=UPI00163E7300|nr:hypothetical protein [Burkholderia gladioli]
MKELRYVFFVMTIIAIVLVVSDFGATSMGKKAYDSTLMASWVQAVGSIAAILGALWIASDQHRRDLRNRKAEQEQFEYLLKEEITWLSGDVLEFMNQFASIKLGYRFGYVISDDEVSDILRRLTWCRQRAIHKGQLAMIGQMRSCVIDSARIVRMRMAHPPMLFAGDEVKKIRNLMNEADAVFRAAASGVSTDERFNP